MRIKRWSSLTSCDNDGFAGGGGGKEAGGGMPTDCGILGGTDVDCGTLGQTEARDTARRLISLITHGVESTFAGMIDETKPLMVLT